MQDATSLHDKAKFFLFPNEKERKLCKKRAEGEKKGRVKVFDLFQGIIKSLSALVTFTLHGMFGGMFVGCFWDVCGDA